MSSKSVQRFPSRIQELPFDSDLFNLKVGRIECSSFSNAELSANNMQGLLQKAFDRGLDVVYLFAPPYMEDGKYTQLTNSPSTLPGIKVDNKTTFRVSLSSLDKSRLVNKAFCTPGLRIASLPKIENAQDNDNKNDNEFSNNISEAFSGLPSDVLELAVSAGEWSRFKLDPLMPRDAQRLMYGAWMKNSANRSIADEVFVALCCDDDNDDSNKERKEKVVGLITLQRKNGEKEKSVSVGLLAVSARFRRRGIGTALLSRAALWAEEQFGYNSSKQDGGEDKNDVFLSVITQGDNKDACVCYERFGFHRMSVQCVYHCWLPAHLEQPSQRADRLRVPFCKQYFGGREVVYVDSVLNSGLDSAARFHELCARGLREVLGESCLRSLILPSCTAALEMACLLARLNPGDEVIMPSYTFSSTANAVVLRGAVPVFVDIRRDTLCIDENLIESAITKKTRAICAVHYAGAACEMDFIMALAEKHGLVVIEDNAQGFLSTYKGRQLGSIGHYGCFSFHYTKNVICGEGGAISINTLAGEDAAKRALVLWEKGTNRYDFMSGKIDKYEWVDLGSSYVPSELTCAVLWAQLEQSNAITTARLDNFNKYMRGLKHLQDAGYLRLLQCPTYTQNNGHIFFMIFPSLLIRNNVEAELKIKGISVFSHYVPLHSSPAGIKFGRVGCDSMEITEETFDGLLRAPVWVGLQDSEIDFVIASISEVVTTISNNNKKI